jgi:antitoxin component of MazEF toxin-antitoxin module
VSIVKQDKVKKWVLPVQEIENKDDGETEYFINLPDDLLEAADLKEGDSVEYLDRGDGSYILKKIENHMTYDEMIAEGWTMTADGFWIKE